MDFQDVKSDKVKNETIFEGLKEGVDYSMHSDKIITLLLFSAVFSFIALTACLLMYCFGFGMTSSFTSDSTLLQSVIDDDKRGRVMSIYTVCFMAQHQ